ncbi:MAG: nuclear transport factor 2 family protein [Gammaproteobacteria bacterium]|nr:MAG: nuclear transport factor 2 family protein [Gammaproteobacteria bacterium]
MNKTILAILVIAIAAIGAVWFISSGDETAEEVAALRSQVDTLQQQAQAANDYVAIANLQAIYGFYVDKARWDDAADLFADDATLEIAGRGLFAGQDRIREYLHALGDLSYGTLFNHMQLQPVIHVAPDGQSAKARWRSFMQVGHLGEEARWGEATYENEYVNEAGLWKIKKLHSFITFYVEFDQGWNKGAVALPKHLDNLEPDAEATVKYGAFPDVFVPPYHYPNPVSGRKYAK